MKNLKSATDMGRELFEQAFKFTLLSKKDSIAIKFSACGHDYIVDIDSAAVKNDAAITNTWLNLFKEFEADLDAGVEARKERIISPETSLIIGPN